ncbi:DNA-3-methyladenine glycosylase [Aporhodopirellula aestuarii]|uniref:Putative 3-methyladenine DNA glycosylase n=1 Tax=Aporhodopirellula aestuarii TaxID=2950107 RepID=A0ABT0UBX0_9BACT|nr:DNA-3-methyladenine glycosylase [Aporhodopirellula aestuarii]MCM2374214.1 DNA-3-methyladenine glycosylase [Aporhodopirellula aestuarii]
MKNLNSFDLPESNRLQRNFFQRDPETVARELLGCGFAHRCGDEWLGGWIVETEAYLANDDPACHGARGPGSSNASMFAEAGSLYVYPIHAKFCVNLVTEGVDIGSAVLIRAIEPVWGIDIMMQNRGTTDPRRITSGPGMICSAMRVDRSSDGIDVTRSSEWILGVGHQVNHKVIATPRIGIREAADLPLRFFVDGNRYVSGLARQHSRPRRDVLGQINQRSS